VFPKSSWLERRLPDIGLWMFLAGLGLLIFGMTGEAFFYAAAYQEALGDRFVPRVLPDSAANPNAIMKNPHSVVTAHLIDRDGEPTRAARDEIIEFFKQRLIS